MLPRIVFYYLNLIVLFSTTFTFAQKIDTERADAYFKIGQFSNAAKHYEFAFMHNKSSYILDRLSDCYLKLNEFEKAEQVFVKLKKRFPLTESQRVKYANLLKHDGKVFAAKTELSYLTNGSDSTKRKKYLPYLSSCDSMIKWSKTPSQYKITNLKAINSPYSEISPVVYLDSLVFASNREFTKIQAKSDYDNQPFFDLYITNLGIYEPFQKPKLFSKMINTKFHESSASFTGDGKHMYYSQCNEQLSIDDSVLRMKLFASAKIEGSWIKPHGFIYNDSSYSFAHPSVEKNNKMIFFASDMKGGFGGTDIYVSIQVEDSVWSDPINLGNVVNTPGNENYPFYHEDGSLFFASDFHTGMGGYDIFKATQKDGEWEKITNLKPPINSTFDDIGIFFNQDQTFGYFSSNRPGGKGNEDIYFIRKK